MSDCMRRLLGRLVDTPPCLSAGFHSPTLHQRSPPYAPAVRGALMIQRGVGGRCCGTGDVVENALLHSTTRFPKCRQQQQNADVFGGQQVGQQQSPSQKRQNDARLSFLPGSSHCSLSIFPSSTLSTFSNSSFLAAASTLCWKIFEEWAEQMVKWASWAESGLVQGTRGVRTGGGDGADGTMKEIY